MKRTTEDLAATAAAVDLDRAKLDELIAVFKEAGAHVTISDAKWNYESLDEAKSQIGSEAKSLTVTASGIGNNAPFLLAVVAIQRAVRMSMYGAVQPGGVKYGPSSVR